MIPFFLAADLFGYSDGVAKGGEYDKAAWYGDFTTEPGAFGGDGFFEDLDQDVLILLEDGVYLTCFDDLRLEFKAVEQGGLLFALDTILRIFHDGPQFRTHVSIMEEGILSVPDIHKDGIETGHDLLDLPQEDVTN